MFSAAIGEAAADQYAAASAMLHQREAIWTNAGAVATY